MANFVKALGSTATPGTSMTITVPAGGATGGDIIVVGTSMNAGTLADPSSVTDTGGNTYTKQGSAPNGTTVRVSAWTATVTTPLAAGDTIVVHYAVAPTKATAEATQYAAANEVLDITVTTATGSATAPPSHAVTTVTAGDIVVAVIGNAISTVDAAESLTVPTSWTISGQVTSAGTNTAIVHMVKTPAGATANLSTGQYPDTTLSVSIILALTPVPVAAKPFRPWVGWWRMPSPFLVSAPAIIHGLATPDIGVQAAVAAALVGQVDAVSSAPTAALTTGIPLVASAAAQAGSTGVLTTGIPLAGSSAGQSAASGTTLNGVAAALAGTAAAVSSTSSASLTTVIRLVGTTSAVSATGAATLSTAIVLGGSATATSVAAASLTTSIRLVGSSDASTVAAGGLVTAIRMVGSVAAQSATTADLSIGAAGAAFAGSVTGSSSASASLTTAIRLGSTVAATSAAAATLSTAIVLGGQVAAISTTTAAMTATIRLAAATSVVTGLTGTLSDFVTVQPGSVTASVGVRDSVAFSALLRETVAIAYGPSSATATSSVGGSVSATASERDKVAS